MQGRTFIPVVVASAVLFAAVGPTHAAQAHHRRRLATERHHVVRLRDLSRGQAGAFRLSQDPNDVGRRGVSTGYVGPGSIIFELTKQAQREPGATLELAPDAKETATGGPVGGVPGFDGN